jgi:glutathione S-transferase
MNSILVNFVTKLFQYFQDEMVAKHGESMEPKLKEVANYLGEGKKFLLGDCITIADFPMYVSLDWHATLDEGCLVKFPALDNYLKNVRADPKIKAYLDSDKHFKARCPPFAPGAKHLNK